MPVWSSRVEILDPSDNDKHPGASTKKEDARREDGNVSRQETPICADGEDGEHLRGVAPGGH